MTLKGPEGLVEAAIRKPDTLVDVSCQCKSIWLLDIGVAERFEGMASLEVPPPALPAWTEPPKKRMAAATVTSNLGPSSPAEPGRERSLEVR